MITLAKSFDDQRVYACSSPKILLRATSTFDTSRSAAGRYSRAMQKLIASSLRATVAYSVYAMHRRPDLYGMDAELFRPERWDEDMPMRHDKTHAAWDYLPFNGGPRICLGSK